MPHTKVDFTLYRTPLSRMLDTVGDGSGTKNAVGNHSGPVDFMITPPAGEEYIIDHLLIYIGDSTPLSADEYGNLAALTNGVQVLIKDGSGDVLDLTDGLKIKTNSAWGQCAYDLIHHSFGSGKEFVSVRWDFLHYSQVLQISGGLGESFVVRLNDDFTGLTDHTFMVVGYKSTFGNSGTA